MKRLGPIACFVGACMALSTLRADGLAVAIGLCGAAVIWWWISEGNGGRS
jgi:hypothetical protein